jgi:hypothetical protein
MGAMKNFAMDVSCALGFDGELNDRVISVASRVLSKSMELPSDKRTSESPEFVDLVNEIDHELVDGDHCVEPSLLPPKPGGKPKYKHNM